MSKQTANHPWEPHLASYPLLILDDHATEWASRIADDDPERIAVDGEEMDLMRDPVNLSSEEFSRALDEQAAPVSTQRRISTELGYTSDRVWSGDVSSGLC